MPTVLRIKGYRFFFYSREGTEPPHIHVERAEAVAKFWLEPVLLADSDGFRSSELRSLQEMVEDNTDLFLTAWNEHFGQ